MSTTTPTAYGRVQRRSRKSWERYAAARSQALAAGKRYRETRSGGDMLAREDAIGAAMEARREAYTYLRWLATHTPIKGSHMSPAALQRAIDAGRVKP